MELVSIVLPVYNKEKYLEKTLNEIRSQTYENIEIICVDDCSTDKSCDILSKYASEDQRIIIFNNEKNLGAAESRNLGLEHCKGEYVIFLDADDEYDLEMIEDAHEKIFEYQADVAVLPFVRISKYMLIDICNYISFCQEKSEVIVPKLYEQNLISKCDVVAWNKLYRASYLINNKLQFQSLASSNDVYFGVMSACLAEKIVLVKKKRCYIKHFLGIEGQISNKRDPMNAYTAWKKICDELKKIDMWDLYREMILNNFFQNIKSEMIKNKDDYKNQTTFEHFQRFVLTDFNIIEDYSDISNCQTRLLLEKFLHLSYEDFIVRISFVKMLDKYCTSKMIVKMKELEQKGTIIVWGAGVRADEFIRYMRQKGINISIVVDRDNSKHKEGNEHDFTICAWNEVKDKAGCVCVLRTKYFKEIYAEIKNTREDIEVINFEEICPFEVEY